MWGRGEGQVGWRRKEVWRGLAERGVRGPWEPRPLTHRPGAWVEAWKLLVDHQ